MGERMEKSFFKRAVRDRIRPYAKDIVWRYRKATAGKRVFPDFVIIGAQKSGTSSLYHWLRQHPQLKTSFKKEVHFFDGGVISDQDDFCEGQDMYRASVAIRSCTN